MAYPVKLSIVHTRIRTSSHYCMSLNHMQIIGHRGNSICDPARSQHWSQFNLINITPLATESFLRQVNDKICFSFIYTIFFQIIFCLKSYHEKFKNVIKMIFLIIVMEAYSRYNFREYQPYSC